MLTEQGGDEQNILLLLSTNQFFGSKTFHFLP
jgi:hypothetical protein